ncbi:MAG: hypothetical protein LBI72_13995 [Flavobacteriaceae bacterium]|jgi:hypothetical protein|nr:hypothetical protein [Flavobacteriaceae bacterium]
MNKLFLLVLVLLGIASCRPKDLRDYEYKGEPNYNSFYIVDTIKIENPIVVSISGGRGVYVLSEKTLKEYKSHEEFINRPDVFVYGGSDLYLLLPISEYGKYRFRKIESKECIGTIKSAYSPNEEISVYRFKNEIDTFLLSLINANYYYQKYNGFHTSYAWYKEINYKRVYYRIVFPYCE